jgi:hypothetical protein
LQSSPVSGRHVGTHTPKQHVECADVGCADEWVTTEISLPLKADNLRQSVAVSKVDVVRLDAAGPTRLTTTTSTNNLISATDDGRAAG